MNRRAFILRLLTAFAASITVYALAQTAPVPLPDGVWEKLPPHPRLFARAERWAVLRQEIASDSVAREFFALIRARAEGVLTAPPVAYVDTGSFLHGPIRQVQGRIVGLAMMWRLTDDRRFLDRARQEMGELAALPSWYPQHFLDVGEAALAMGIGLDWLHDDLSAEERETFVKAIVEKALQPSFTTVADALLAWVAQRNNWNPVCPGGLVVAALAVAEREPELARRIVERALENVPGYAALYAPAGACSEGPGYWAYGTTFYVLLAEALRTTFGTTCDLEKAPGFLRTADYMLQMTAPSGALFNFADSTPDAGFEPVKFWFARELRRRALVEAELGSLTRQRDYLTAATPRDDASRLQPLALLWWDATLSKNSGTQPPLSWWSEGGTQPQAVLRSAWNDPHATFVGIKAGTADDSHAHMDVGSFVLEANGVRWAVDLGRESYPLARKNGIPGGELFSTKQDSRRWSIFRAGPDAHNILRFDGAPQRVDATATITPANDPDAPGFIVDLTPIYGGQATAVRRRFSLRADRHVVIEDTWTTGDHATEVSWQWLTRAAVTPELKAVVLSQSGETLRLSFTALAALRIEVEDVSESRHPFDSPNAGLRRIVVRQQTPARSSGQMVIEASPGATGSNADPSSRPTPPHH